jgi:hypothetical protein
MNYEQLSDLKDAVDTFDDASFVSLLSENTVLLKNDTTDDLWSLPFKTEEGKLLFLGENAELVEKNEIEEDEEEESLVSISKRILSSLDEAKDCADDISKALKKNKKKKKEAVSESLVQSGTLFESLRDEEKDFVKSFQEHWNPKLESFRTSFLEFYSQGSLFENNAIKSRTISDPRILLEEYAKKKAYSESLFANSETVTEFVNKAKELGVTEESLKGVDPLGDWQVGLTKNLVLQKKSGSDINVHETISQLKKSVLIESSDSGLPDAAPTKDTAFSFLKMNGKFSKQDVSQLVDDFSKALGRFNYLSQEQCQMISALKDKVDYMFRTGYIDDEEVADSINTFNKEFGHDARDLYRNPETTSGIAMRMTLPPTTMLPQTMPTAV